MRCCSKKVPLIIGGILILGGLGLYTNKHFMGQGITLPPAVEIPQQRPADKPSESVAKPAQKAEGVASKESSTEIISPEQKRMESIIDQIFPKDQMKIGFEIPESEKSIIEKSGSKSTYGELLPVGAIRAAKLLKIAPTDIVYDLGSGTGRALMMLYLVSSAKKYVGIEISKTRDDIAQEALKKLRTIPGALNAKRPIEFQHQNVLNANFSDATVIYISSLCFPPEVVDAILDKIVATVKPGCRILTSKPFSEHPHIGPAEVVEIPMSWRPTGSKTHMYSVQ
ncbi:MAG: methyltransferase domain-containing protein [Alphaproteobacteria bacterium]|nr:methyltransferase domain-containing protein [Alphaproteobacteria bacterium]